MASVARRLRRRPGMPKSKMQARAAPPAGNQGTPRGMRLAVVQPLAAVVEMVRVALPAVAPVMLTGLVEPKLKVGRSCAPLGLEVTAAVSATLPVKPPAGVTVIVDATAAPGATVTAVPVIVKLGVSPPTVT